MKFILPVRLQNTKGAERKAGFEFEFAGLDVHQSSLLIRELFGGRIRKKSRFEAAVATTLGTFEVALDARLIKDRAYLKSLRKAGIRLKREDWWEDRLEEAASAVVPYEISAPPIPFTKLAALDRLREAMRRRNARGTKARLRYAFGMHINPEIPDEDPVTSLNVLRSFLLYHPWLVGRLEVDLSRRVMPFINSFPDAYVRLVMDSEYRPDRRRFMEDYLAHNPTRNRPLDLLPIFCAWHPRIIRKALPGEKVKPRKTYHYRLPNCSFDEPRWRIAREWNHWVAIEDLAADEAKLLALAGLLLEEMHAAPLFWRARWARRFPKELRR